MTLIFFALALLGALLTLNLYQPFLRVPQLAIPSFVAGWLVGELLPFVFGLQFVSVFAFGLAGAFRGPWGALGLALVLASWLGMAVYLRRAWGAGETAEQALRATLGSDYRSQIAPELLAAIPETVAPARLLHPFRPHLPDVVRERDIPFYSEEGVTLRLDLYRPQQPPQRAPVLVQIHGGAWTENFGSKNEQGLLLMNQLAAMGWVCVALSYRLSPAVKLPTHVIDCKRGLAWVKSHIADYGGDPDFVVLTGGSAGGHLCSLVALTANRPDLQPGFEEADTAVQGCVPFYGVYDLANEAGLHDNAAISGYMEKTVMGLPLAELAPYRSLSPLGNLHPDAPPFMVIHGTTDSLTSFREGEHFARELARVSRQPVVWVPVRNAQHAFDLFRSPRSEQILYAVVRFVNYLYSRYRARR